jgi:hypothetical protein
MYARCEHGNGGLERYDIHFEDRSSNIIGLFLLLAINISRVTQQTS